MTPEGKVVARIKEVVKMAHGEVRKCQWVGHVGAPDLFVMLPHRVHAWFEVKAPGEKPKPHQLREHEKMEKAGCSVYVVDRASDVARILLDELMCWCVPYSKQYIVDGLIEARRLMLKKEAEDARA